MPRKNIPDAKHRILQAALTVFAEKSFEGSRIDEIATAANVPKSLIYYHFESKNDILNVLYQTFLAEFAELLKVAENDTHRSKASEMIQRSEHYRDFYIRNADLIRIMLIDSLKKSSFEPVLYQVTEAIVDADGKYIASNDLKVYSRDERLVAEFFTNILPLFAFLCFHSSWTHHFGIEAQRFETLFTKILAETHGAYHRNHE